MIDLGSLHLITDRPDATPAPTAGPGDPDQKPTGPWAPNEFPTLRDPALDGQPPVVALKECDCGVLKGEECDCAEMLAQMETHLARPIWFRQQGRAA